MKQATIIFFENRSRKENFDFLMLLKEYMSRYNYLDTMYSKTSDSVLLRNLAVERNAYLNSLLGELRKIEGLDVPANVRVWQADVTKQLNFVHQFFRVLSEPEVRNAV